MTNPIGQRIRTAREDYGMSQAELARRIGISPQSMNAIEMGRVDPKASLVGSIAQALRVRGDYLLCLSDDKDIPALLCSGVLTSVVGDINTPAYAPTLPEPPHGLYQEALPDGR
jgi:DNA-binding XRE family transcriptional regulator